MHEEPSLTSRPTTLLEGWDALPASSEAWKEGDRVGAFRLERRLGQGGMGLVWLAEQVEPLVRKVALKVIRHERRSSVTESYFEVERQLLAQLSHRAIAQIHDAGRLPDDSLFFAMEYVDGRPLDDYAKTERPDPPTLARLFVEICAGVQHAHQRGLIHRDLKPANILLEQGDALPQPKIIDFGVAIAIEPGDAVARIDHVAGTLAYMSPEQRVPGPAGIDVRSDLYALGVVFAECLCRAAGVTVTREALESATLREHFARSLGQSAAAPPSHDWDALKQVPAELRAIALMAMAEARDARYQSATAFAEDLGRWLARQPVRAMGESRGYRLRCFIRRNALACAAGAVLGLGLIAFATSSALQAQRIAREADRANQALAELEQVAAFQARQLENLDAAGMAKRLVQDIERRYAQAVPDDPPAQQALGRALQRVNFVDVARGSLDTEIFQPTLAAIDGEFAGQPLVRARLLESTADAMRALSLFETAGAVQQTAYDLRRAELGAEHPDTLETLSSLAGIVLSLDDIERAESMWREALAGQRKVLGDTHPQTLVTINNMGYLLRSQGRYAEAEPFYRESIAGRRAVLGERHADTATAVNNLAVLLNLLGRTDEAVVLAQQALDVRREALGEDDPRTIDGMISVGALWSKLGQVDQAETMLREALKRARRVNGNEDHSTIIAMRVLGGLLHGKGEYPEAGALLEEAHAQGSSLLGAQHPSTLQTAILLGQLRVAEGRHAEALDLLVPLEDPARNAFQAASRDHLARLLVQLGVAEAAVDAKVGGAAVSARAAERLREAYAIQLALHGAAHEQARATAAQLAQLLADRDGGMPDADRAAEQALWRQRSEAPEE